MEWSNPCRKIYITPFNFFWKKNTWNEWEDQNWSVFPCWLAWHPSHQTTEHNFKHQLKIKNSLYRSPHWAGRPYQDAFHVNPCKMFTKHKRNIYTCVENIVGMFCLFASPPSLQFQPCLVWEETSFPYHWTRLRECDMIRSGRRHPSPIRGRFGVAEMQGDLRLPGTRQPSTWLWNRLSGVRACSWLSSRGFARLVPHSGTPYSPIQWA